MKMGITLHYGKFDGRDLSIELAHEEKYLPFDEWVGTLILPSREKLWELSGLSYWHVNRFVSFRA
jgi:predicted Abi (CAAX) family protease